MKTYDLSNVSMLVVDTNAFMREVLRELLDGLGVGRIVSARSLDQAWDRLMDDTSIDVVLTELDLEQEDGVKLINMVRSSKTPRIRMLPLLVLSSDTRVPRIMASRDAGATEFMAKPISAEAVYRRLVQVIERPRPFVRVGDDYFGPDRRRQIRDFTGGDRRDAEGFPARVSA